jgi:hypothetical protein
VRANLAGAVVVANIVKIRLRKRHAKKPQGQEQDPESSYARLCRRPPQPHARASFENSTDEQPS